jgi:DNA invertase Pin-like site-specific DNA recombinase
VSEDCCNRSASEKEEAKYLCSSCGAEGGCQCNAPAVEKLAEKMEQDRRRAKRAYEKKKDEQNQSPSHVGNGNDLDTDTARRRFDPARVKQLKADGLGPTEIARTLNIGRASVYRVLEQRDARAGQS